MSDSKDINISVVPKFADKTLENMLDKPSKSIGDTFSDIWYLVLGGPIGSRADKRKLKYAYELETFEKSIKDKLAKIPENKKIEPDIQVVGQLLESSKYCVENKFVREMFANLLTSSMDGDKYKLVHPLYGDIIKKMSHNDAILFYIIALDEKMTFDFNLSISDLAFSFEALTMLGLLKKKVEHQNELSNGLINTNVFYDVHKFLDYINAILSKYGYSTVDENAEINIGFEFQKIFQKDFELTRIGEIFKRICF